ncbi:MAG: phosphate ABC transporter permease subunit PstC [Ruminococcaceae bacterium]|nr:phosphate ABC transporter permease subunit PstC [Oscillospiraceae bacterium]
MKTNVFYERWMQRVFLLAACVSVAAVALICGFLLAGGIPALREIGLRDFLLGRVWKPGSDHYGVLPMILGSIYITSGAMLLGVPLGVLTAVWLARFCPETMYHRAKPAVELLAGIPSIVFGFFGLMVMVPLVRQLLGGSGRSILTASLLLGVMILPSIIGVAESALRAVPDSYYEGALALGATHERAVFTVVLPAARSGILAGIVLGLGRAAGEATAVAMVAGNQTAMPYSLLRGVRTLTTNIIMEMGYAEGLHRQALFAVGAVLFLLILLINLWAGRMKEGERA